MPGLRGNRFRRYRLDNYIEVDKNVDRVCQKVNKAIKVKIIECNLQSSEGDPIREKIGQIVETVDCPKEYKDRFDKDIWVQGKTEPVRLLAREYKLID